MDVRQRLEREERERLSPLAMRSGDTRGREAPLPPCDLRTEFQRDRDRILHCKAFRRLKHKTQCFLVPDGDHFRTRLTHTLEVSQIARTVSRALRLNEDLTEAIALGHDLGHTPFGHMGERILDELRRDTGGFRHEEQSLRVVERLENDGRGLNLTWEVRDGIVNHTSHGAPATLEGQVVSIADRVAYINHDIDDAIRAGVLHPGDIPRPLLDVLGDTHGRRIDTMIRDLVDNSADRIRMSETVGEATARLRAFMFERVYQRPEVRVEEEKARHILFALYERFMAQNLPVGDGGDRGQAAADFLAGMTDRFAVRLFGELFLPRPFTLS